MKIGLFKNTASRDLTTGNLFLKMILFALPIMMTTVMQLLYVTIDLMTVHFGDSADSMGAIASNNALINLIVVVFTGVSLGVNVIVSEAKGANDPEKASKVLHTSLLFALISGIGVGLLGFFISDNLLEMMGTEEHYLAKATLYLKIYFSGLPFLMIYNYCAQLLRAQGDSRSPFFILMASGFVNVGFDCIFVFPLKMGVAGVGWATVISEGVSAILGILMLTFGKHNYVKLNFKKLRIDKESLFEILRVGLPAGLQGFFFSLPNVFIQANLYTIEPGNAHLENGASASGNIEGYFYAGIDGLSTAVMTFIAANIGAKKKENIGKIIRYGFIWGVIYCALVALVTGLLYRPLLSLFVDSEESLDAGRQRLFLMGFFYLMNFAMGFTAGILRGFRRSALPMFSTLIFCTGLRILLLITVFPLEEFHTIVWLYALFPITWVLATGMNLICMFLFLPKDMRKINPPAIEEAS